MISFVYLCSSVLAIAHLTSSAVILDSDKATPAVDPLLVEKINVNREYKIFNYL